MKISINLGSKILLFLSIIIFFYIFYRAQIHHQRKFFDYYKKYYLLSLIFFTFSIVTLFLKKELTQKIILFLSSIIFSLYLIELFLMLKPDNPFSQMISDDKKLGVEFDSRSKVEFYSDSIKKNPDLVMAIPGMQIINKGKTILRFGGISNRKTVLCNESGQYVVYQSDRYGFNNPDEEWEKEKIDFLLVGDSFTHGYCVNTENTMSGNLILLKKNNNGVINLGAVGSGPIAQYASLREYLPIKKVKNVLWMFYGGNDITDFNLDLNNEILLKYINDKNFTQNLKTKQKIIDKILINLQNKIYLSKKKDFIKLYNVRSFFTEYTYKPSSKDQANKKFFKEKKFKDLVKQVNEFVESQGANLYFVYLPPYVSLLSNDELKSVKNLDYKDNELANYQQYGEIIKIINDLNIPVIDLKKEVFDKSEDPFAFYPFGLPGKHYNELGYKKISETILSITIK